MPDSLFLDPACPIHRGGKGTGILGRHTTWLRGDISPLKMTYKRKTTNCASCNHHGPRTVSTQFSPAY